MSRRGRIAAFALGLALLSFPAIVGLQAWDHWQFCRPAGCPQGRLQPADWAIAAVGSFAMLMGGIMAARSAPADSFLERVFGLLVRALLVAFPVAALVFAFFPALVEGPTALGLLPIAFGAALFVGAGKYGATALVVTALRSIVYAGFERRVEAR
jgi:hypothetical protein